jgi:hypothetical protein
MNKKEIRRYKIKRILWENYYTRELEKEMIEGLVSPSNFDEYIGRNRTIPENSFLRAITKMIVALLLNRFMDKCIDMVIEAYEIEEIK